MGEPQLPQAARSVLVLRHALRAVLDSAELNSLALGKRNPRVTYFSTRAFRFCRARIFFCYSCYMRAEEVAIMEIMVRN